jgi:hypothetical protein
MDNAPALSQMPFHGAGVMVCTQWPNKPELYTLFTREAGGRDKGTWDIYSGKRDAQEKHPVATASREFAEESCYIFGNEQGLRQTIDVDQGNTFTVLANTRKNFVIYMTLLPHTHFANLANRFYKARNNARSHKLREKDGLPWVKWSNLQNAVVNAQRDAQGHLLPVTVWANVLTPQGRVAAQITLRPVLVSSLQPYFKNFNYTPGKNPKIRFY